MIISYFFGRRRVAAGERPGWLGAWGLVVLDFAVVLAVFALIWEPLMALLYAMQPGTAVTIAVLFVVLFLPMQAVLIWSSIWAAKSRWDDKPGKGEDA